MPLENVCNVGNLRSTLKVLKIANTTTTNLSQIFQCDILHKSQVESNQVYSIYLAKLEETCADKLFSSNLARTVLLYIHFRFTLLLLLIFRHGQVLQIWT